MKSTKKRICVVLPTHWAAEFGGAEYQAQCIIDAIEKTQLFDVTYLARETNLEFKTKQYNIINIGSRTPLRRYAHFFDAFILYRKLKLISPDIIYQRVGCSYTGITSWYAKRSGCNMIWHIAIDTDLMSFQGGFAPKSIFKFIEYLFLQYGIRNSPKIIAQTKFQDNLLRSRYKRNADAVIPNFHHDPKESIKKEMPINIVWVANLKPYKRPDLFVELAKQLHDLRNVKFTMIGKPQHKEAWLKKLFDNIKQVGTIEYTSNASFAQVNQILAESHVFVNTSLFEGFPNTFIQAWMRRVPVVSLNINPDDVFDREDIGFCSGSFENLVKDVKRLVEDNDLRESMGKHAESYVMKSHSMRNAQQIIELM